MQSQVLFARLAIGAMLVRSNGRSSQLGEEIKKWTELIQPSLEGIWLPDDEISKAIEVRTPLS